MVTITNGMKTFRVTAGAVKPYEGMGFHVVTDEELEEMNQEIHEHFDDSGVPDSTNDEEVTEEAQEDQEEVTEDDEESIYIKDLLEKPLTQWSNDEVRDFVRIKGIDTSGAQKISQVRGIIKNYLEEQQKNNV